MNRPCPARLVVLKEIFRLFGELVLTMRGCFFEENT
jgi:hypothetical protein